MLELIVLCFSVAANLALAVLIFAKNSQKNVNKYFALFAVVLVGWSITNYISVHPVLFDQLFWIRLDMAWAVFMSMSLLLLINVFPSGVPFYAKLPRLITIPSIILAAFALSPWLFTHVDYSSGSPQPVPGLVMIPFALYTLSVLGLSIAVLVRRYFSLEGKAKEYIRYAIVGMATTFLLIVFFNFVLVVAFHNTFFIDFTPAVVLIFSISFVYGMIRHQLFDIRLIVARFIAYLLLLTFAGALYGFTAVAVSSFIVGVQPNFAQIGFSTVVVGVLILFAQPLRQFFNRITRTLFYQDDYDTKNVLDRLASVLVHSIDTGTLANESMTILRDALKSEYITMFLVNGAEKEKFISVGSDKLDLSHVSVNKLLHSAPNIMVTDIIEGEPDRMHKVMQDQNVAVVARLQTHGGVIGYCFFGYKTSGSAYGRRDIDLIRIASDELAVAIQNAMSVQAVKDINATLQQRIQEATKELRASNAQLHRLDAAKDEFVSMASHQLRTPLTSVKGYISMVLEGDAGRITAAQRQLLEEAFTSSERMVHLISDFLNVSRLQTGKFMIDQRAVDLVRIISQEVDSLQTTASAHDLKLQFRAPSHFPILYVDEGKLRQVVMNFIDNAIYYSSRETTIRVELAVIDGSAVLQVRDTGIGVPKAEQAHLFTKFFRASNARKQRPDGTGVGLFLAKKVILAHGGSIVFESTEGEGSTFGFRLPIKKLSSPSADDTNKLGK